MVDKKELEKVKKEILDFVTEYAKKKGFQLNPNKKIVDGIVTGLAMNKIRFGEPYCPCRVRSGDPEKDKLIICPCAWHEEEIKRDGKCHCGLFVRAMEE